jgi:hypothetical protein
MSIHVAGVTLDRTTVPLWAGVLGSPLLWALQFQVTYMLVPWTCTHRNAWLIPLIHIVSFVISVICGVLCWLHWRRLGSTMPESQEEELIARTKFLAVLGLMTAALFSLLILAHAVPSFYLDPCWA